MPDLTKSKFELDDATRLRTALDAQVAALYFLSLIGLGVNPNAATSMTGSYISGIVISRSNDRPKEKWEEG